MFLNPGAEDERVNSEPEDVESHHDVDLQHAPKIYQWLLLFHQDVHYLNYIILLRAQVLFNDLLDSKNNSKKHQHHDEVDRSVDHPKT